MTTEIQIVSPNEVAMMGMNFDAAILAGQCAPSTIAMYRRDFGAYLRYAGSVDAALESATLSRWISDLAGATGNMAPSTINRMVSAVKRLVSTAAAQGYCPNETAAAFERVRGVKVKALKDRQKVGARTRITPEDMRKICEAPNAATLPGMMHRALLATLASSGCRISEIVTLTEAQIAGDENTGYIVNVMGKNQTEPREAPLSPEAHALITAWLAARTAGGIVVEKDKTHKSEFIFTGFSGRGGRGPRTTPIDPASAWSLVQRYATACELTHVKPHDFRRFVGTQLAKTDIRKAQKALGHKSIETTAKHYVLDTLERGMTDHLY